MASYPAIITEIEQLAPSVLQLTVALESAGFRFQPGQWVNFRFPEAGVSRAYTIASAPERPQAVQLCVRIGSGKGGALLLKLEAGASVTIDGPYGDFVLPPDDGGRRVVFLAGDTGIAPVRSIILHMLATHDSRAICVLYEPDHRHILYAADFDPLARSGAITHESGRIETLIARNRNNLRDATIMACGFDPFLERANQALAAIEVDPGQVVRETFGPMPG
ncbi:MAG: lapP [Acidobacteria bacterium]|nr:lapP [Acidobacteriota bacterium]